MPGFRAQTSHQDGVGSTCRARLSSDHGSTFYPCGMCRLRGFVEQDAAVHKLMEHESHRVQRDPAKHKCEFLAICNIRDQSHLAVPACELTQQEDMIIHF